MEKQKGSTTAKVWHRRSGINPSSGFEMVAEVTVQSQHILRVLAQAYKKTNSEDGPWWLYTRGITLHRSNPRSTSVDDVVSIGNRFFLVTYRGWEELAYCKTCHGTGKVVVRILESNTKVETTRMPCSRCDGLGRVSLAQKATWEKAKAAWCSCGKPSKKPIFFKDGEHPEIHKHHWRCGDCGKIDQMG